MQRASCAILYANRGREGRGVAKRERESGVAGERDGTEKGETKDEEGR